MWLTGHFQEPLRGTEHTLSLKRTYSIWVFHTFHSQEMCPVPNSQHFWQATAGPQEAQKGSRRGSMSHLKRTMHHTVMAPFTPPVSSPYCPSSPALRPPSWLSGLPPGSQASLLALSLLPIQPLTSSLSQRRKNEPLSVPEHCHGSASLTSLQTA